LPQTKITSDWYAHSSFPSELRDALVQELKGFDIIVGVHAPLATRLASCKPFLGNVKLIGWIHNSYEALFSENSRYIGSDLRKHYEFQLQKLHLTIVLCQYDALQYSFPTKVIYNPLTLIPGDVSQGTSKKFLAVGRFSRQHKGFDLLIKAFHIFCQENHDWVLDIVDEGDMEYEYKALIKDFHLERRITIHPFTNNIQQYYSNAQVYVLSSRWEGMPLVLVEAMSHGLPILASDIPTCQEVLGDFGLFFKNGDLQELAQRLEDATHLDWQKKSDEAITIAQRFDINQIAGQWKQLIER
jgi:glycosyltransferase involved in cell wall biosynthesis